MGLGCGLLKCYNGGYPAWYSNGSCRNVSLYITHFFKYSIFLLNADYDTIERNSENSYKICEDKRLLGKADAPGLVTRLGPHLNLSRKKCH